MMRSIQGRLVFNTILISLVAILSAGMVTIFLINTYFNNQEKEYLRSQASRITPVLAKVMNNGTQVELQRTVAMGAVAGQMRVQLYDNSERLIADSGPRADQTTFNPLEAERAELYVGAVIDDSGQVLRFSPIISQQTDSTEGTATLSLFSPAQYLMPLSSFTAVSDSELIAPITWESESIGVMRLSEGPAVGDAVTRNIWIGLLVGSSVALAAAVVAGLLSARQIVLPVRSLGTAVQAMGAKDLDARAPGSKIREFDQLASQFNQMAEQLSGNIERLNNEREILRRTISDAGHEFRTPLTALKTFNALLEEEVNDSEQAKLYVLESKRQINQMQQITSDILDLSRLESRLSGTNFIRGDLREPIKLAAENIRSLILAKNITFSLNLPAMEVETRFDQTAIAQAVSNLLSNAVKYTPEHGEISVCLKKNPKSLSISVRDNGSGIPEEVLPFIFDRFYRYPSNSDQGSGLGLAICREIVEIHNGQIKVKSEFGEGSEFIITLPAGEDDQNISDKQKAPPKIGGAQLTR